MRPPIKRQALILFLGFGATIEANPNSETAQPCLRSDLGLWPSARWTKKSPARRHAGLSFKSGPKALSEEVFQRLGVCGSGIVSVKAGLSLSIDGLTVPTCKQVGNHLCKAIAGR